MKIIDEVELLSGLSSEEGKAILLKNMKDASPNIERFFQIIKENNIALIYGE